MFLPVFLLDSYALIYRAYFAFISRPLRNRHGENISALFGFSRIIVNLLSDGRPKVVIAVFDPHGPTFRHKEYPPYKATRQKAPDDLHSQVPLVEEFLKLLGIPTLRLEGFEADDVIATLEKQCAAAGRQCFIVSGDKDLLQLVGGGTYELRPLRRPVASGASFVSPAGSPATVAVGSAAGKPAAPLKKSPLPGFEIIDEDGVLNEWGVKPVAILDYLSITGDASDNVPGIKGIGEKGAAKLLLRYGTLESIYENITAIEGTLSKKLIAGKDDAFLSKKLITLKTDVPLPVQSVEELRITTLSPASAVAFLREHDINSISQELTRLADSGVLAVYATPADGNHEAEDDNFLFENDSAGRTADVNSAVSIQRRKPRSAKVAVDNEMVFDSGFSAPRTAQTAQTTDAAYTASPAPPAAAGGAAAGCYQCITDASLLPEIFRQAEDQGFLAIDFETNSLDTASAKPVGVSLALKAEEAFYVPIVPHGPAADSPFVPPEKIRPLLAAVLDNPAMTIIAHNAKFDYKVSRFWGLPRWRAAIFDTMIAAWLIDPDRASYSLDNVSRHFLNYTSGISYKSIVPKGQPFNVVPLETACRYSAEDADMCLRLRDLFLNGGDLAGGLADIFYTMEMPLLPLLAEMEIEGIQIDTDELKKYGAELAKELSAIQFDSWRLVGHEFNLASPLQLQDVLFVERGLKPVKKTATSWSTDVSVLKALAPEDELCRNILRHRALAKLKSTYVDALCDIADANNKLHTTFFQAGTATGRLSSRDPNLQNIPIREEEGRRIREAFTAGPGRLLISADYNQIELVVLAHLSEDAELCASFERGEDVHRRTAARIFGIDAEAVSAHERRVAKTINFGVMYGMSAFRLASNLGISRTEAMNFIQAYFKTYAGVQRYINELIANTEKTGYVTTMYGRRRYIRMINSTNKIEKSAAERITVNTPIQGSAADIVKRAMLLLDAELKAAGSAAKILLQVHDELILDCPEDSAEKTAALVRQVMENAAQLKAPLRVTVETGKRWGGFH
ncbi:MAG: DNA polymerase I [Spirochaetaceae bacterium]|jgi:DNA polymerase-1|nr:DNA polymerase I [Spirochaetaceae bacterium]